MPEENCSAVMVFNNEGKLALQKRAADDKRYPSRWDFTAAGHIEEGEAPEAGAIREMKEEIGIESPIEFVVLLHLVDEVPYDLSVFKTHHDGPFTPDPKEVDEVRFFPIGKIKEMAAKEPQTLHPELFYFLTHRADLL